MSQLFRGGFLVKLIEGANEKLSIEYNIASFLAKKLCCVHIQGDCVKMNNIFTVARKHLVEHCSPHAILLKQLLCRDFSKKLVREVGPPK